MTDKTNKNRATSKRKSNLDFPMLWRGIEKLLPNLDKGVEINIYDLYDAFKRLERQETIEITREPSAKAKEVFSFIEAYVTETNNHPTLEEIMEATGVVKSYASKLRSKYFEENA